MFYMVSFAKGAHAGGDFDDYCSVGGSIMDADGVHSIIAGHRKLNGLTEDGYEHFYHVYECEYDPELEGGFEIIESFNYEIWLLENPIK